LVPRPLGLFTTSWLALGWADYFSPRGTTSITLGVYLFGFATASSAARAVVDPRASLSSR
jgi:hypothetical protein